MIQWKYIYIRSLYMTELAVMVSDTEFRPLLKMYYIFFLRRYWEAGERLYFSQNHSSLFLIIVCNILGIDVRIRCIVSFFKLKYKNKFFQFKFILWKANSLFVGFISWVPVCDLTGIWSSAIVFLNLSGNHHIESKIIYLSLTYSIHAVSTILLL